MDNFLTYMDAERALFIDRKQTGKCKYKNDKTYFYRAIRFSGSRRVSFKQQIYAVKVRKTAILYIDQDKRTGVYFTDEDIQKIIADLDDSYLKKHILCYLEKVVKKEELPVIKFRLSRKSFAISGIPFDPSFNCILCKNPADILLNGNDLIAMINLILEKDRTDLDREKVTRTAAQYSGK